MIEVKLGSIPCNLACGHDLGHLLRWLTWSTLWSRHHSTVEFKGSVNFGNV